MSEDRGEDAEAVAGAEGNGEVTRRGWLGRIPGLTALAALAASYGTLLIYFVRVDHPPVLYAEPLTRGRLVLGVVSLAIFVLSFSIKPLYFV